MELFLSFFKIGLFTFGGGISMIPIMENEFCINKKWISQDDMLNMVVISEATPGPLAVNSATFIGYKIKGVFGSFWATLGVVLPSFIIILIISVFYNEFISISFIEKALKGVKSGVVFLIFSAFLKFFKKAEKNHYRNFVFLLSVFLSFILNINVAFIMIIGISINYIYISIKIKKDGI
ncbi:MAG: chromate transporter [Oscillospiraceae bacterium]